MTKAKKIETFRDKWFTTVVYEYRGEQYEVTYANGSQVCCTPAWVQHRDAQEKIDDMLDNPKTEPDGEINLDEIWEIMGW
jgi:hypothetical protein